MKTQRTRYMKKIRKVAVAGALLWNTLSAIGGPVLAATQSTSGHVPTIQNSERLPMSFEANHGQAPSDVLFLAHGTGYSLSVTPQGAALTLSKQGNEQPRKHASGNFSTAAPSMFMRMTLAGSNPHPHIEGQEQLPGTVSYYIGSDKTKWHGEIPTYKQVHLQDVYPGIDVVYYGNQQQLEYDFVVAPGADPTNIKMTFQGIEHVAVDATGALVLSSATGEIRQHKPVVYQEINGARREVSSHYVLVSDNEVSFHVDDYDREHPLVIDPVLTYATYFGGTNDEVSYGIATDTNGNMYMTGTIFTSPQHVFVSKLNAAGTAVQYMVILGDPTCDASGESIAVDGSGNAYVTGTYGHVDQFGYCNNDDALAVKLNATGVVQYNHYFGAGRDSGTDIVVDAQGNAYITGHTAGDWPTTPGVLQPTQPGFGDAFVLKLNSTGNVIFSTYLGSPDIDEGTAIAVDAQSNVYVAGTTQSAANFPTTATGYQRAKNSFVAGFVSKLNATGSALQYSTYLSGTNNQGDSISDLAIDGAGKIYVTGSTTSRTFPTTASAFDRSCGTDGLCNEICTGFPNCNWQYGDDIFVTKFDPTLSGAASLIYSTFIGGENRELAEGIAVDAAGNAYVTGRTASSSFPINNAIQSSLGGDFDVFVTAVNATGSGLLYSTYLGGSVWDEGRAITVDQSGTVYATGLTGSTNFPTYSPVQGTNGGGYDAFLVKILNTTQQNTLTVTKAGTGSGTVISSPAGVNCGTDCSESYNTGTVVTLSATPATGSTFAGWSGSCTGTGTCSVTMSAAKSVTATFTTTQTTYVLTVAKIGTGAGTVTSSPVGISCGTDCSESYSPGTVVTLTATPASGSTFAGWSGNCTGTSACSVTMSAAKNVTATFNPAITASIAATDGTATEAGRTTGTFTFTRTGSTASALTIFYTIGGQATPGTDYTALPSSVTIPAGATAATLVVTPVDDTVAELSEAVTINLVANAAYTLTPARGASVIIQDNDTTVSIAATDATATEASRTTGTFTVTRVGPTLPAILVRYTVTGTATAGSDYAALSGTVSIPSGATTATIVVTPVDDTTAEGNETVIVNMKTDPGYTVVAPSSATVTISSDE